MSLWLIVNVYCGMNIFRTTQMGHSQLHKDCKHTTGIPLPLAPRGYNRQSRTATGNTSTALNCCCRRKVQEGKEDSLILFPGILTCHNSNMAHLGLNHATGQMLPAPAGTYRLWPELRNCPNTPKGKAGVQTVQVSLWPQNCMVQQPESINAPQFLCWFAIMLLLCMVRGLYHMPCVRPRYRLLYQGVKGRMFPLVPLHAC